MTDLAKGAGPWLPYHRRNCRHHGRWRSGRWDCRAGHQPNCDRSRTWVGGSPGGVWN